MNIATTFGKVVVLAFGAWVGLKDGGVVTGLAAYGVIMATVSTASDLTQAFRTGYFMLDRSPPRWAQRHNGDLDLRPDRGRPAQWLVGLVTLRHINRGWRPGRHTARVTGSITARHASSSPPTTAAAATTIAIKSTVATVHVKHATTTRDGSGSRKSDGTDVPERPAASAPGSGSHFPLSLQG
uniref:Transposon protein, putative, unclassified n=2 Tax=Oryza sativa subsp. japonica TaxID=39947 RepID=Q8S7I1_ORYSJ|nr:hypothetical protein [Oryza sativa Japonica Group]ABF99151.1 transposon protein, putative, unclassified [Oryza sativa Japonica Group]